MKCLNVSIEIMGEQVPVGKIMGEDAEDGVFSYNSDYLAKDDPMPISLNLPLKEEPHSANATKVFFEGLLPEGFTRRTVAGKLGANEDDYISILAALGDECLGAIRITDEEREPEEAHYKRVSLPKIKALAAEGTTESANLITEAHLSLTGASGKIGLYLDEKRGNWFLPMGDAPSSHIVKQSHVRFKNIVANEQLCLKTAERLGVSVPESFIINLGSGEDGEVLFASRRFDRDELSPKKVDGHACPYRKHQEDFAQALGIKSGSKYEPRGEKYFKRMGELIRNNCRNPLEDLGKLWDITVFNYLIGNADNHIKNLSLLYSADLKQISLAPAFDMLSTAVYKESTRNMAFNIGGLYSLEEIDQAAWERAAKEIGLGKKHAAERMDYLKANIKRALRESATELADQGFPIAIKLSKSIREKGGMAIIGK